MTRLKSWLRGLALFAVLFAALAAQTLAADTPEALLKELEQNLRAQNETFSIPYTGDAEADGLLNWDYEDLGYLLRLTSARSPDGADNADMPTFNIYDGDVYLDDGVFDFEITYMATQEELDEVSAHIAEILAGMDLDGEDDYTKLKLIYEYICSNFIYDDTLSKFTAYEGLTTGSMVCQGYALLTNEMLWQAGIPCRIVSGYSGEAHAWNIAKLDGQWYNLDTTWDAVQELGGAMNWNYFLKSPADFGFHYREEPYQTDAYEQAHPMAQKSRELPRVTLQVNGDSVAAVIIRKDVEVQLVAETPKGSPLAGLEWVCENPELVELTEDGRLIAKDLGKTLITVRVEGNRGVISAQLPVQTVDLTTASDWAVETVTAFYLEQLLPVSLCDSFQQGITRAELARLLDRFVDKTKGYDSFSVENTFADIDECEDGFAILNCYAIGLLDGTSSMYFRPDDVVTREQAAKVLVRLMNYLEDVSSGGIGSLEDYTDADSISQWAAPFVATATRMDILQGSDGQFKPQQVMTREQMVMALSRIHGAWRAEQPQPQAA